MISKMDNIYTVKYRVYIIVHSFIYFVIEKAPVVSKLR